jgi:hypothetical protein
MTLPSSPPLSGSQVATELGLSLPLSFNHAWVIALAGKSALPVSFSDLLGKSGHFNGNLVTGAAGITFEVDFTNSFFFGGQLQYFRQQTTSTLLMFSSAPNWNGNIIVTNTTSGVSSTLTKTNSTQWNGSAPQGMLGLNGSTNNITVYPSN